MVSTNIFAGKKGLNLHKVINGTLSGAHMHDREMKQKPTKKQWEEQCACATIKMRDYVKYFITPVAMIISYEEGKHYGSGTYIEFDKNKFLITNEHVARKRRSVALTHQFHSCENILLLTNDFILVPHPRDVAITKIDESIWTSCKHSSRSIKKQCFAAGHEPVEGALLVFPGYSGQKSMMLFGSLAAKSTPHLSRESFFESDLSRTEQEALLKVGFDPEFHFLLSYSSEYAKSVDKKSAYLPTPPGFSGSLVWNTRLLEVTNADKAWTPEDAKVTGIVWGWDDNYPYLVATKIEHLSLDELITFG